MSAARFRKTKKNLSYELKWTLFFPTFRKRISFSFLSTAFSERIVLFYLTAWRKKRRRDARKGTMSALEVGGMLSRVKYRRFKDQME
jgi:hypothetical protein